MIKFSMQEALKSSLETSVVPSFEVSCKAMFEQVDTTFQRGMAEHTSAAQHQFESSHSPLALALRVSFMHPICVIFCSFLNLIFRIRYPCQS